MGALWVPIEFSVYSTVFLLGQWLKAIGILILPIWPIATEVDWYSHSLTSLTKISILARRGSGVRISDSTETVGYVFGYRNMKKATILDPNAKKSQSSGHF